MLLLRRAQRYGDTEMIKRLAKPFDLCKHLNREVGVLLVQALEVSVTLT